MKNIKLAYLLLIPGLTALWLLADNIFSLPFEFFAYRTPLLNFSGIIGIQIASGSPARRSSCFNGVRKPVERAIAV